LHPLHLPLKVILSDFGISACGFVLNSAPKPIRNTLLRLSVAPKKG